MLGDISVPPKERINIVYQPKVGDVKQDVELPLKLLVMGDFKSSLDDTPMEARQTVSINQNNFNDVLKSQNLHLDLDVPDEITGEGNLSVSLDFQSMNDFEPDAIIENDKSLLKLKKLRDSLVSLKGPLGNKELFKKKLQEILDDETKYKELMKDLELISDEEE